MSTGIIAKMHDRPSRLAYFTEANKYSPVKLKQDVVWFQEFLAQDNDVDVLEQLGKAAGTVGFEVHRRNEDETWWKEMVAKIWATKGGWLFKIKTEE